MDRKHTHRGTCQICGSTQAVDIVSGKLAVHGYTVKWGYFSGTCRGSNSLPMQHDRTRTDEMLISLRDHANACDEKVSKIDAGTFRPANVRTGRRIYTGISNPATTVGSNYQSGWLDEEIPFDQAMPYQQQQAIDSLRWGFINEARGCRDHAKMMGELADQTFGTDLFPVVRPENPLEGYCSGSHKPLSKKDSHSVYGQCPGCGKSFKAFRNNSLHPVYQTPKHK